MQKLPPLLLGALIAENGALRLPPNLPGLGWRDPKLAAEREARNKPRANVPGSVRRKILTAAKAMTSVPPPRQLSTEPGHPWFFENYPCLNVFFNGELSTDCTAYDADAGWIDHYTRDGKGGFVQRMNQETGDPEFAITRSSGEVRVEWLVTF